MTTTATALPVRAQPDGDHLLLTVGGEPFAELDHSEVVLLIHDLLNHLPSDPAAN